MFARTVGHAIVALGLLAGATAFAAEPASQAQGRVVLPTDVTPEHYDIAIQPDAAKLNFRGHVDVRLKVAQPTDTIVLNAADLVFGKVSLSGQSASPRVELDAHEQTAALHFPAPIPAGVYTLSIDYTGKIYLQASGFFALDYAAGATKKRALFTQFENSDARRFVPSWDEPGTKATFTLSATVPASELAVSNMPVASSEEVGQGLKRVRFAESPKMSTYLLYFCLGDFERVHRQVGKTDVGVVVKRGDTARAQYALDAASQLLPYYDDYFGTPYPLPKLDMIGGPGTSQFFGAMENWGAIFYFESDLLIDQRISTDADRMSVYSVIAHEMAHQWFGDLVTMSWWDDLWLNEGFASWMEDKATDHFHPDWKVQLRSLSATQAVMREDASEGTHPIVMPIRDVFEAANAFDDITYTKGQAVIRMLEAYVGEQDFRTGVRNYMKRFAYATTVTDDLWREIDAVTTKKIGQVAHDFTLQAGVPLIGVDSADCVNGKRTLSLTQDRFTIDSSAGRDAPIWHVPVDIGRADGHAHTSVIVSGAQPTKVTIDSCAPFVVNSGQTAYFRVRYAKTPFANLSGAFASLQPADQIGTLKNTAALAATGGMPYADFMELAGRLPLDADPVVWSALTEQVSSLDEFHNDLPTQRAFRVYERALLGPKLAQLGWDTKPGESDNAKVLRSTLLLVLGHAQDPAVVTEARKRFAQFLAQPQSIPATVRSAMLGIVAANADEATWEKLRQLAQHAPTELEKGQYVVLLGQPEDPKLAQRALDLALTEEAPPTLRPRLIRSVSGRFPEMAVEFTIAHWEKISPMLEADSQPQFVPRLASGSTRLKILEPLNAFAKAHMPPTTHRVLAKSVSSIRYNAQIVTRLAEVDKWVGEKSPSPQPSPAAGRGSVGAP